MCPSGRLTLKRYKYNYRCKSRCKGRCKSMRTKSVLWVVLVCEAELGVVVVVLVIGVVGCMFQL